MMIKVDLDDLVGDDRRQFHRVVPSVEEPIILRVGGEAFPLLEVSGGGCRLPIAARSYFSETDFLELCLPGRSSSIPVRLRTVSVEDEAFGAAFIDLDVDKREVICTYVRMREIELVRRFRN
ncbi:MAG: PilZ domain-containing protein [Deltaproteobacteria bacterium]|nr:PilZ domain-containing protein [Candidatus Tharpella sp.]